MGAFAPGRERRDDMDIHDNHARKGRVGRPIQVRPRNPSPPQMWAQADVSMLTPLLAGDDASTRVSSTTVSPIRGAHAEIALDGRDDQRHGAE